MSRIHRVTSIEEFIERLRHKPPLSVSVEPKVLTYVGFWGIKKSAYEHGYMYPHMYLLDYRIWLPQGIARAKTFRETIGRTVPNELGLSGLGFQEHYSKLLVVADERYVSLRDALPNTAVHIVGRQAIDGMNVADPFRAMGQQADDQQEVADQTTQLLEG